MALFDCCDCRTGKNRGAGNVPGKPGLAGDKMCGVGITFIEDSNGALYVKSLVPGGSAAQSGQVQVGDVLVEVSEQNVYCSNPEQIGNLLLGTEGSEVQVAFKRSSTGAVHSVSLRRCLVSASHASQAQGAERRGAAFSAAPASRR